MGNKLTTCGLSNICGDSGICNLHILPLSNPQGIIYRKDYQISNFLIETVYLSISISNNCTNVYSRLTMRRNPKCANYRADLVLDGDCLKLLSVKINGTKLVKSLYKGYFQPDGPDGKLVITSNMMPKKDQQFTLETEVQIIPEENTRNMGLCYSGGIYSTQCESDGFRRITYFLDRPDIMAKYRVRVEADKSRCPVLLSNGNLVESGDIVSQSDKESVRHYAIFADPYPKPCYLFAAVAGNLQCIEDSFVTMSGRTVKLFIYSEPRFVDRLTLAMESLKLAMKWDEEKFGLEYDLDVFNIVAVESFNFGAMENKSLNIFNVNCLLASDTLSTDNEFIRILGVVGHEYFHNYTGNRVTCRDWFQLTLKEGLTVYRDQEFTKDLADRLNELLLNVDYMKSGQFAEDAGPLAHPIRPDSVLSTNNLYTVTVYEKGAEVVRMYEVILGKEGFRKGMDLYFARHDGHAVTCDDFRQAMADANNVDLAQFERWYSQAGTPEVEVVSTVYDSKLKTYSITLRQRCSPSPGQPRKRPFYIPITVGLLCRETGKEILPSKTLILSSQQETFVIDDVESDPVPSILRDFSAPVLLKYRNPLTDEELALLLANDTNHYNRYESAQALFRRVILAGVNSVSVECSVNEVINQNLSETIYRCFGALLSSVNTSANPNGDTKPIVVATTIMLPSFTEILNLVSLVDIDKIVTSVRALQCVLASRFENEIINLYHTANKDLLALDSQSPFIKGKGLNMEAIGLRKLMNVLLDYLKYYSPEKALELAYQQFNSTSMTAKLGAISVILAVNTESEKSKKILDLFYELCNIDTITLNKFFSINASIPIPETYDRVVELYQHPEFVAKKVIPSCFRSLIGAFSSNIVAFNRIDGSGYKFLANAIIEIDSINGMTAAALSRGFSYIHKLDPIRQALMKSEIERILDQQGLSKDTSEILRGIVNQ
ncbi:putative peptidase family M1 [Cryptosporidium serpentis]